MLATCGCFFFFFVGGNVQSHRAACSLPFNTCFTFLTFIFRKCPPSFTNTVPCKILSTCAFLSFWFFRSCSISQTNTGENIPVASVWPRNTTAPSVATTYVYYGLGLYSYWTKLRPKFFVVLFVLMGF